MHLAFAFFFNSVLVLLAIILHYEVLYQLDKHLPRIAHLASRFRVLVGVGVIFMTHVVEIWMFGIGYYVTLTIDGMGHIAGGTSGSFLDCVYLSFITFTTVGYGDVVPAGDVRYLTGIEALTGLILITWSASFLFLEMQKYWSQRKSRQ